MMQLPSIQSGIVVLALFLGRCDETRSHSAPDLAPITRDERWRSDLRYFATQLAMRHKNAFARVSKEAFARAVADLDTEIPDLSDSQVQLRIARLAAMLRDAHTHAQLPSYSERLPIALLGQPRGTTHRNDPRPNRVGGRVSPPASHTTGHAGPRPAVPGSPDG